jgi:cytidylate kinase
MSEFHAVAIDGPSGAGKSTLARRAAEALSFLYVDTGAIYRSVGWYMRENNISPHDADAVEAALPDVRIELRYGDDGLQHMLVCGRDVTEEIRRPEMSRYASAVAAIPAVRAFLLEMQRDMARKNSVVMDGRDIGTVVLPDADVKIFLTASPEVRAERRRGELLQRGTPQDYESVLADMKKRDEADRSRAAAPLKRAGDAMVLDTSRLDFEQSAKALIDMIKEKINET